MKSNQDETEDLEMEIDPWEIPCGEKEKVKTCVNSKVEAVLSMRRKDVTNSNYYDLQQSFVLFLKRVDGNQLH